MKFQTISKPLDFLSLGLIVGQPLRIGVSSEQ